nr:hypothetical protein [uncultured Brevundimonas sp.]
MTIQIQKEDLNHAVEIDLGGLARVLAWAPAADLMQRRYNRWAKAEATRQLRTLGEALEEVFARMEREPARKAYAVEVRRRARLDRDRVKRLNGAMPRAALTKGQLKTLAEADALDAKAAKAKGAERRRLSGEALRMRRLVETGRSAALSEREDDQRLAETVALEAVREGELEVVEKRRGQTQVRLRTRDGLKLLHERGGLKTADGGRWEADRLLSVGLRYRDRYERAQSSLKSCLNVSDGARVQLTLWETARLSQRRAVLANQVRELDIAVGVKLGAEAVQVLRAVAGEARTIRSLASGGKRRDRLAGLLKAALGIVAGQIEMTR